MKDNNQLESFLRDKLSEKSFPYDEAYWEQAQQQFAEWDQQKKRRRGLLWIFAGLLLCSIGGWTLGQFLNPSLFSDALPSISTWIATDSTSENLSMCADMPIASTALPDVPVLDSLEAFSSSDQQTVLPVDWQQVSIRGNHVSSFSLQENELGPVGDFVQTKENALIASVTGELEKQVADIQAIKNQQLFLLSVDDRFPPQRELLGIPPSKVRFYLQLGVSSSLSQQLDSSFTAVNQSPVIETGVVFPTQAGINVSLGLTYFSTPLLNTSATMTYTSYDFILREEEKQWTPEQLHFAGLHVGATTRILPRHEIGVDVRLNYLLTTRGTLGETSRTTFESVSDEPTTVWHYRDGLQSWDVQAGISYQFHLNQRWSTKAAIHHGFSNLTQDARFAPAMRHRNSRLSLSLVYWLP